MYIYICVYTYIYIDIIRFISLSIYIYTCTICVYIYIYNYARSPGETHPLEIWIIVDVNHFYPLSQSMQVDSHTTIT